MSEADYYNDFFLTDDEEDTELREHSSSLPIEAQVRGEVLRVVFSNEQNSYAVLKMRGLGSSPPEFTMVGTLGGLQEGQEVEAQGRWELHPVHGRQFQVQSCQAVLPTSEAGIMRYLASGVLPGIGKVYAKRIVKKFGSETLKILDNYTSRLAEVPGIGKKRIAGIRQAWQEQGLQRESMIFLQGLGISPIYAQKIIKFYGVNAAAEVVRRNPYRLASDIDGIGFLSADRIASAMDIEKESPLRLSAGVVYTLNELAARGNVCYPQVLLLKETAKMLRVSDEAAAKGLQIALAENQVSALSLPDPDWPSPFIYLRWLRQAEEELTEALQLLLNTALPQLHVPWARMSTQAMHLNREQQQAVHWALHYGCSIITGGPGVGKTTVVSTLVQAAKLLRLKVCLAAPTGRAAMRMSEASNIEAMTIHRLLKWDPARRNFYYGVENKLDCHMLIIDEVSMLDMSLAASLFRALQPGTRVVLVGDKDQLPSVGPGTVLRDLINCRRIPVTYLTKIYRQKQGSRIILNAHAVNRGQSPDLRSSGSNLLEDFYWIEQDEPQKVATLICRLVSERIPQAFGYDPIRDAQVLSPMRKGEAGVLALNVLLQEKLNPPDAAEKPELRLGNRVFRLGDKVMQTTNNYNKTVFNGELGRISRMDSETFSVLYDDKEVEYKNHEADQLILAYASTVHKSQGCEFPAVVMPLLTQHYVMLQRNLLYTGMTRAKKLLILIGSRKALEIAVANNVPLQRISLLEKRLSWQPINL
ncbi:MAG: ATP-dependent RecD-like DNA helicase [Oligosphaeraceae bacterium]|nr:ATP-dependent RecD-like DNA helicase [Oligosphaeraceae bacterium]